jgi:hypothetical protein
MIDLAPIRLIEARAAELAKWLEDDAPYAQFDQLHLEADTPERAYWHLGYRAALIDALALLKGAAEDNDRTSNYSPVADPDV